MALEERAYHRADPTRSVDTGPQTWFELGLMYCNGREVALDLVEAHKWFNIAATHGNEAARRYRAEIARELTRAEIGDAQRRAREWLARRH